jgi:hypothetical protein
VSSTPNIQSTAEHMLAGAERKMNGIKLFWVIIMCKKLCHY